MINVNEDYVVLEEVHEGDVEVIFVVKETYKVL